MRVLTTVTTSPSRGGRTWAIQSAHVRRVEVVGRVAGGRALEHVDLLLLVLLLSLLLLALAPRLELVVRELLAHDPGAPRNRDQERHKRDEAERRAGLKRRAVHALRERVAVAHVVTGGHGAAGAEQHDREDRVEHDAVLGRHAHRGLQVHERDPEQRVDRGRIRHNEREVDGRSAVVHRERELLVRDDHDHVVALEARGHEAQCRRRRHQLQHAHRERHVAEVLPVEPAHGGDERRV